MDELEEKPRLRRWFEGALLCKLDVSPFGRPLNRDEENCLP